MNHSQLASYAVACLEGLDHPQAPRELSRSQHVPFEDCLAILERLEAAGLVRENAQGLIEVCVALEQITALEVLQAVWAKPSKVEIQVLFGIRSSIAERVTRLAMQAEHSPLG